MKKQDNIQTRMQMLKISFQDNKKAETKALLSSWGIRDLYDILDHAELAGVIGMEEFKLKNRELEVVLEVLNVKGNEIKEMMCTIIQDLLDGTQKLVDDKDAVEHGRFMNERVRMLNQLHKEFPNKALKEIADQSPAWKAFFKKIWPGLKTKYLAGK